MWSGRSGGALKEIDRLEAELHDCDMTIMELKAKLYDLMTGKERKRQIQNFAANSMPSHYRSHFSKSEWEWERNVGREPSWKRLVG